MMATFTLAVTGLDHPVKGLQAALAIRDKAAFAGLPVGIGIAVGPAVVGQFSEGSSVTAVGDTNNRSEGHTAELQSQSKLVCRLLLEKKKIRMYHAGGALLARNSH